MQPQLPTASATIGSTSYSPLLVGGQHNAVQRRSISTSHRLSKDKKLFTPGPLGVTLSVKEAMLRDVGSRDSEFIECVKDIRQSLLDIAGVDSKEWASIPIQGSGTFAVDSVFQTFCPREDARALVIENGAYGKRMEKICKAAGIACDVQSFREDRAAEAEVVGDALRGPVHYDIVAVVHCETSSGVFNPVEEIGQVVKDLSPESVYMVDAMSSFGAVPLDLGSADVMVSSANKCLQGVPGFSYVLARWSALNGCEGNSRTLSLDLYDQVKALDASGQFRFTPATHSMLAFRQALREFEQEGGVIGRANRYRNNRDVLRAGMTKLGFRELLAEKDAGYIITSYYFPDDPKFNFKDFYGRLNDMDLVIYPGKVLDADCFRIGNIGDLHKKDMEDLLVATKFVLQDMGVALPVKYD